jgi:translation initiation factor IF-3
MVRVILDGEDKGIYSLQQAIQMADNEGLDLVEIAPNVQPPVCKVVDYKKFLYEKKKKQKEIKAKSAKVVIKEIRLSPNIDDHDFNFKLKHAIKFLEEGAKIKVDVFFKGRSILYKEQGEITLLKFADELSEYGKVEQMPKLEGKKMLMMITPKK